MSKNPIYRASKPRGRSSSPFVVLFILLILFIGISSSLLYVKYDKYIDTPMIFTKSKGSHRAFTIKSGESSNNIITKLKTEEFISSDIALKFYVWKNNLANKVQKGSYTISPEMSPKEIFEIITGKTHQDRWLVVPSGWRLTQIAERLSANNISTLENFKEYAKTVPEYFQYKDEIPEGQSIEGYLYPDSYKISNGANAEEVVKKSLNNFSRKLTSQRLEKINESKYNLHQLATLASLIEREARYIDDKYMVSGVMYNRLNNDMRLDIDASTSYALNQWKLEMDKKELDTDSPYNTRKYKGIPPGPISNFTIDSLDAALSPKKHDYFYYISEPKEGKMIYAKDLNEHNINVANHLR
jgi:UPF0755 protein